MNMKPLVERYNKDKAAQEKRKAEAAQKLADARRLADSFYDAVHIGPYDRFKVFAGGFLQLLLETSTKHEYHNADLRWQIRAILKQHALGEDPDFEKIIGAHQYNQPPPRSFGTRAVFTHLMRYWEIQYDNSDMTKGFYGDDTEQDFVNAIAKAVADFRAPIDADKLKALLGLLYDNRIPLD